MNKAADAPPGRKDQVEKLKEKGMSDDAAFGIAWNQHKEHGEPDKESSLKKRTASKQEVQHIFELLQQIAPKYKNLEDVPAVTPKAARIIVSWYREEFEDILGITAKYLFQDLPVLRDAPGDMIEFKTVWPNYDLGDDITASLKFSWQEQRVSIIGQDVSELARAKGIIIERVQEEYVAYIIKLDIPRPDLVGEYTNFLPNDDEYTAKYNDQAVSNPGMYVVVYSYDIRKLSSAAKKLSWELQSPVKTSNKENKMKKKEADMEINPSGDLLEGGEEVYPKKEPPFEEAFQTYRGDKMDREFQAWFEDNKDSDLLWEEYNNYVHEASSMEVEEADSFNVWMRNRFDALYSSQQKGLKKEAYNPHIKNTRGEFRLPLDIGEDVLSQISALTTTLESIEGGWYKFTMEPSRGRLSSLKQLVKSAGGFFSSEIPYNDPLEASQKVANGIAVNILPSLFEDKFPLGDTPRELMLLRSKARQALTGISKKLTASGRDATPIDFPVEWFYKNFSYASPEGPAIDYNNYVTEVRAQLQDIINYGNSITGENFYANAETTIYKISRNGEKGVKILREKIDGKINRYGYINEKGTFVVLPNHRELRKTSKLQRPDTGENITIISYEDFSLGSTASMIDELIQKKSWGYENPYDIESQEAAAENPYFDVSEDTSEDDLFIYLKRRHNKIQEEADNLGERIEKFKAELDAHISTWPEEAQQRVKNTMTSVINHVLIKEAFGESDAEVGSPEWVDAMLLSASNLDWEMAYRETPPLEQGNYGKSSDTVVYVTDLLLDAAKEQGVQANVNDALQWYDNYHNSPLYDAYFSKLNKKIPKYSIDVSDEIPPMGWNTSDPGMPAGAGAPKEPLQSLQDDADVNKPQDANVLYDSKQDTGPQYQVTMNPKNKEVSIKFMDSPEQEALKQTIQEDTSVPQVTPLDQLPKLNTTPPAGGIQEEPQLFNEQEVPVAF